MISKVLSTCASEPKEERYVNYRELFEHQLHRTRVYAQNSQYCWDNEDIHDLTEKYCNKHINSILQKAAAYLENIHLIQGPREFLIDCISTTLRVGQSFEIELIISDSAASEFGIVGRLNLMPYVVVEDIRSGIAYLRFENDEHLPLHWLQLSKNQNVYLRLAGAIKILSSVDYILQVERE